MHLFAIPERYTIKRTLKTHKEAAGSVLYSTTNTGTRTISSQNLQKTNLTSWNSLRLS